jgi:DNA-binding CsgD family transcriptional regulator
MVEVVMLTIHREAPQDCRLAAISDGARLPSFDGPFSAVLDELDYGVLVCGISRRVVNTNASARAELALGKALSVRQGMLHVESASDHEAIQLAFRHAASGRRKLVPVGQGSARFFVSVLPVESRLPEPCVLLMLGRKRPFGYLAVEMFCSHHGLTHSERRVLVALLEGRRPADVAEQFNVAVSTVRTQVAAIREKLGVKRVEDLLQIAAGLPPLTSVIRPLSAPPSP